MVNRFLSWRLQPLLDFLRQELHVWLSMVLVIVLVPVPRGEICGLCDRFISIRHYG